MIGLFDILNTFISTLYPIFATYKAVDEYGKTEQKIAAGNINIGGFNVPIQPLLKRAAGDSSAALADDSSSLQWQMIRIQKWLVYWMVTGALLVVQQVLFLRYILPFFSLIRMCVSIWLLLPLISPDAPKSEIGQPVQQTQSWEYFTRSGCGLVFEKALKPALEGELQVLSNLPFDPQQLLSAGTQKLSFLSFACMGSMLFKGNDDSIENKSTGSYVDGIKGYLFRTISSQTSASDTRKSPEAGSSEQDEYYVVNKPAGEENLTRRKPQETVQAEHEGKTGWFW